ncbi:hypothetical protein Tco_1238086 [Tanacetum coccineum]
MRASTIYLKGPDHFRFGVAEAGWGGEEWWGVVGLGRGGKVIGRACGLSWGARRRSGGGGGGILTGGVDGEGEWGRKVGGVVILVGLWSCGYVGGVGATILYLLLLASLAALFLASLFGIKLAELARSLMLMLLCFCIYSEAMLLLYYELEHILD